MKEIPADAARRAYTNVTPDETGCWVSNYHTGETGYAMVTYRDPETKVDGSYLAHRASWTHVYGRIREGMTIDHQCYNRACVNPSHLREISLEENSRRRNGEDWPLGFCKFGHPDTEQVDVVWSGKPRKMCAACMKDRNDANSAWRLPLRRLERVYGIELTAAQQAMYDEFVPQRETSAA